MGLLDLVTSKVSADIARHKATKATSDAKIATLKTLETLANEIQSKMQPQMEFDKNAPDVSATDAPMGQMKPNPSLVPKIKPPEITTGNKLIDMLIPGMVQGGDFGSLEKMIGQTTDPKAQIVNKIFGSGSPINLQPGQAPNGDVLGDIIDKAALGDKTALSYLASLKIAGIDITDVVQRAQEANKPIKRTIYDESTGKTYEALYNRQGSVEIPNTRNLIKKEEVQWVEEALPGGGLRKVPYRGTERVEMVSGKAKQSIPSIPPKKNFDIAIPGAKMEDFPSGEKPSIIDQIPDAGVITKLPNSQLEINSDDLPLWVKPEDLSSPEPGMTPTQAKQAGFQRLSTNSKATIDSLKGALQVQSQVLDLTDKVFPKEKESILNPNRVLRPLSAALQTDPNATVLFNLVNATLAPLIRSLGEKGNLSDTDIKRAAKVVLKGTDTAQVARQKISTIVELLGNIQRSVFAGGSKTSKEKRFQIIKVE